MDLVRVTEDQTRGAEEGGRDKFWMNHSTSFMLLGQKNRVSGRVANHLYYPRSEEIRTCL